MRLQRTLGMLRGEQAIEVIEPSSLLIAGGEGKTFNVGLGFLDPYRQPNILDMDTLGFELIEWPNNPDKSFWVRTLEAGKEHLINPINAPALVRVRRAGFLPWESTWTGAGRMVAIMQIDRIYNGKR